MGAGVSSLGRSSTSHRSEPALLPDQLPCTFLCSSDLVVSVLVTYLKMNVPNDFLLIEIVDNVNPRLIFKLFFTCFWNTPGTD